MLQAQLAKKQCLDKRAAVEQHVGTRIRMRRHGYYRSLLASVCLLAPFSPRFIARLIGLPKRGPIASEEKAASI